MQTWTNSQPASRLLAGAVAGDAMTDRFEAAELLDVDVDEFARPVALIAAWRLGRFQRLEPIEAEAPEHARDRCVRDATLQRDLRPGPALASQCLDPDHDFRRGLRPQAMRPGRAIAQPLPAFRPEAAHPGAHGLLTHADARCHVPRPLAGVENPAHHDLSTGRRQSGILVNVHSVPPRFAKASATSACLGRSRMDNLLKVHT